MSLRSDRFGLPLLVAGQGQKDVTHNEALVALDALVQMSVNSRKLEKPPVDLIAGMCWIVGPGAEGDWTGKEDHLALWTQGGWRFAQLPEGCLVWVADENSMVLRRGGEWQAVAIPERIQTLPQPPSGGQTIDAEARAVITQILARLADMDLVQRD